MTRIRRNTLWFILWIVAGSTLPSCTRVDSFSPYSYLQHVRFLADDSMKGRANGSAELDLAAEYIAGQFRNLGLLPRGDAESYYQSFTLATGNRLGPENRLSFDVLGEALTASLNRDYTPFGIGEETQLEGGVVFAGYGITHEDAHYDDYQALDVTNKFVLVMGGEPPWSHGEKSSQDIGVLGQSVDKAINAKFRGACGILIIDELSQDQSSELQEVIDLGISGYRIGRSLANRLIQSQKKDLTEIKLRIDETLAPRSFGLVGVNVSIQVDVAKTIREVRNVVAMLPCVPSDSPACDEAILIGAHYDHIGDGRQYSRAKEMIGKIHNGADDNASGTAGLIALASALATTRQARQRSYIFLAFAGEEIGLRGSAHWTKHPTWPMDKVVAMINMDMIGRSQENRVSVGGIGTSPVFPELVAQAAEQTGIEVQNFESGYGSSDHSSFYMKDLPVLFFFSGIHSDYHLPSDDWQKINAEGATRILRMVHLVATQLGGRDTRPSFTKVEEPTPVGPVRGGSSGYGSYFGSVPDMTDDVRGVRFADIRPNSPAAKAGLRGMDVLVAFNGKEIRNLTDFTYMLRTHKPGETVHVTVERDGQPLEVEVTLAVRR